MIESECNYPLALSKETISFADVIEDVVGRLSKQMHFEGRHVIRRLDTSHRNGKSVINENFNILGVKLNQEEDVLI